MSSEKWSNIGAVGTLADTDEMMAVIDPNEVSPTNNTITIANLKILLQTGVPFTWASSDEDSPLITGLLYTSEAADVDRTFSKIVLALKNTPTASVIEINIIEEDGNNSNDFPTINTIFSTKPQIQLADFINLNGTIEGALTGGTFTWTAGNRLQIILTLNDTAFAATGIKVTLR